MLSLGNSCRDAIALRPLLPHPQRLIADPHPIVKNAR